MAFEPVTKDLEIKFEKKLNQENVPVVLSIQSTEISIAKIVSISTNPCIDSITCNNTNAQVEGKVLAKILIEDEEKSLHSLDGSANFTAQIVNSEINPESEIFAISQLLNISNIQASKQALSFTCNILIKPTLISKDNVKFLESISPKSQQKVDEITYVDLVASSSQNFDISTELELPQSISKILSVETHAVLKKVESGNDIISLNGELYSNMLYLTNDETPKLKNQKYIQEFNHELIANNITTENFVEATLQVNTTDFEVQGELNNSKATVILKNQLHSNILVRQQNTITAVTDAFCPDYEFNIEYASFSQQKNSQRTYFEKIDGNLSIDENSERIDKILAVSAGNAIIQNTNLQEDLYTITGILKCNIIFKLDDEENSLQSIFSEVPFEINLKTDNLKDAIICPQIVPKDIEARIKKSKEIDILADLAVTLNILENFNGVTLQNISLGEKRTNSYSAMGYYIIPEAKDIWEVSKALLTSQELILEQNPELTFPITSPQKILIYRQKKL